MIIIVTDYQGMAFMITTDELIKQAISQAKAGNKAQAKKMLAQVVKQEPQNARAWYLLSYVVDNKEQAVFCINKVLEVVPGNEQAQGRLQELRGEKVEAPRSQAPRKQKLPVSKTRPKNKLVKGIIFTSLSVIFVCCILTVIALLDNGSQNNELALIPTETIVKFNLVPTQVLPTQEPIAIPSTSTEIPANSPVPSLTPIPTGAERSDSRPACIPQNAPLESGLVTNIVDGDTIKVSINGQIFTVRYIGIDTPETKHPDEPIQYFGPEAAAKNQELVGGKSIILVKDVSEIDQYGRLLRYVFVDSVSGIFVNYELVRQGYAYGVTYPPDVACADYFRQAEQVARNMLIGLWGPTPIPSLTPITRATSSISTIVISNIFFDGIVPKVESDEYAVITNQGASAVNMKGWRLNAGNPGQDFIFPDFVLGLGQSCRVYTNEIHSDSCGGRSFSSLQPVWNNNGDCGYLYDENGVEISKYCY